MKFKRKLSLFVIAIALSLTLSGCKQEPVQTDTAAIEQKNFATYVKKQFIDGMQEDYISMHNYMEKPESYGIDVSKVPVVISEPINDKTMAESKEKTKKDEAEFSKFKRELLTEDQKITYDLFANSFALSNEANKDEFKYMGTTFESMSGLHTQLTSYFTDFIIRKEKDAADLVKLLNSVKPYMESALLYTKEQADNGYLMIDIDAVIKSCEKVLDEKDESTVLSSMHGRVDKLDIDDQKKDEYKQQLTNAFKTSFLASYQMIIDTMNDLKQEKNNTEGLVKLKNGKAYYELLFKMKTGSSRSIDDTEKLLKQYANQTVQTRTALIMKNPQLAEDYDNGNIKTAYKSYEEMLQDLNKNMKNDFPDIGDINYDVKAMDKAVATDGIVAYYNIPALDSTTKDQIRVNTTSNKTSMTALQTFTTMAHEGLPGHMYQFNYAKQNVSEPSRKTLFDNSGYSEGYATYVELYSLNYLDIDEDAAALEESMSIYQNCLIALMDIGIHYHGWSQDDLSTFMKNNGMNEQAAKALYSQLQANPGAFLSYYVGYIEIQALKDQAKQELDTNYTDKEFHETILKNGNVTFDILKDQVEQYITSKK